MLFRTKVNVHWILISQVLAVMFSFSSTSIFLFTVFPIFLMLLLQTICSLVAYVLKHILEGQWLWSIPWSVLPSVLQKNIHLFTVSGICDPISVFSCFCSSFVRKLKCKCNYLLETSRWTKISQGGMQGGLEGGVSVWRWTVVMTMRFRHGSSSGAWPEDGLCLKYVVSLTDFLLAASKLSPAYIWDNAHLVCWLLG